MKFMFFCLFAHVYLSFTNLLLSYKLFFFSPIISFIVNFTRMKKALSYQLLTSSYTYTGQLLSFVEQSIQFFLFLTYLFFAKNTNPQFCFLLWTIFGEFVFSSIRRNDWWSNFWWENNLKTQAALESLCTWHPASHEMSLY